MCRLIMAAMLVLGSVSGFAKSSEWKLSTYSANKEEVDISKIPLGQCTFEKVGSTLSVMSANRASKIAENTSTTLDEINNIVSNAKNPHSSNTRMGDFLTPHELDKFAEASQRQGVLNMESLLEGAFERDIAAIYRLVELAGDYYRDNKIPLKSNKDDYLLFGYLILGHKELSFDDLKPVKPDQMEKCNLDYALFSLEVNSLNKMKELNEAWDMANAKVDNIYAKYPKSEREFKILSESDKNEVSFLANKYIFPLQKELYFIQNIELIRRYGKISQLKYESSMSDLLYSGGDISKTDVTMNKKIKNGELSKADIFTFKVWNVINEKMPSWVYKEFKKMSDSFSSDRKK